MVANNNRTLYFLSFKLLVNAAHHPGDELPIYIHINGKKRIGDSSIAENFNQSCKY